MSSKTLADRCAQKFNAAREILMKGDLFVHVISRGPGLRIPEHLHDRGAVHFQFGHNLPVPIPDLCVDPESISGTLSFNGQPNHVFIPWPLVWSLTSNRSDQEVFVWRDDVPGWALNSFNEHILQQARFRQQTPRKLKSGRIVPSWLRIVK